jgi:trk system potassium uptake protein TrkA
MNIFKNHKEDHKGLNIIVVGAGKVGSTLVEQLSKEGHDITIIDKNKTRVEALSGMYDV